MDKFAPQTPPGCHSPAGQMQELQAAAHTVKGSLIQFVARPALTSAARLEEAARVNDTIVPTLTVEFIRELDRFDKALRQYLDAR